MHGVPQGLDVMHQPVLGVACFCPMSEPWRGQIQGLDFAPLLKDNSLYRENMAITMASCS
jgi:hypothetical protein